MSKAGQRLIESAKEALAIAKGEAEPARVFAPETIDVAAIRKSLGLSQARFASRFRIPVGALRDWEQRRRQPDAAARNLLKVIEYAPDVVEKALS